MRPRFPAYFVECLQRAGMSQRAFARSVGYAQANVQQIAAGRRTVPIKHIERWLGVLRDVADPDLFRELALLTHCPEPIQDLVEQLRAKESKRRKR